MGQPARKPYPKLNQEKRRRAEIALILKFKQIRPDLKLENKELVREERLIFVSELLGRKTMINSLSSLTDSQIHFVLDEMNRKLKPRITAQTTTVKIVPLPHQATIVHLASEEQLYTFDILLKFLGWNQEQTANYLKRRWRCTSQRLLTFAQANSLMVQLLNMAAQKDLKTEGKKTGRKENRKHIPTLKKKLGINS